MAGGTRTSGGIMKSMKSSFTLDKKLKAAGLKQVGKPINNIREFRLRNGLKVITLPLLQAPVCTLNVVYRVGSRNEGVGNTGATHFLEHMMFKGTKWLDPQKGLDGTELLNRIGAVSNATTWFDRTNYYETFPSEYLEFCLRMEADRMRNLRLRQQDRDAEMSVVRNEMERGENSPDEALDKEIYATAFREHPYHHPTIGWRTDVENVPMFRLKEFYDQFYWPENCTVILVGDFEINHALRLVQKYFGKIPACPHTIPDVYTQEPPQEGERRVEIQRVGDLPRVWIAHHVPSSSHPDHHAINLIMHLLGNSYDRSSRLYAALIETGLAVDVFARHDELRDPSLFIVGALLNPEGSPEEVEAILIRELQRLQEEPVSTVELEPIMAANRKGSILARADQMEMAFALGEAEARADWRWLMDFDEKFEAVTSDKIRAVAQQYFSRTNRTCGRFLPEKTKSSALDTDQDLEPEELSEDTESRAASERLNNNGRTSHKIPRLSSLKLEKIYGAPAQSAPRALADRVISQTIDNGLKILMLPLPGSGVVSFSGLLPCGSCHDPVNQYGLADVTAEMLSRGSEGLDKFQLATVMKELGISEGLEIRSDVYRATFGATVVAEDSSRFLTTLATVLQRPLFATDELERLKIEWHSRIVEAQNNTGPQATNKLYNHLYPKGHVFHAPAFEQQLERLSALKSEALASFFENHYSPRGTILAIVGDFVPEAMLGLVMAAFGDWKGANPTDVKVAKIALPKKANRIEVPLADKSSMDIMLGHATNVKRLDPDFYPLMLGVRILGGDTITSRLGKVVREQHGLTYGIYSSIGDTTYGAAPFTISLSVNPANAGHSLQLVHTVLERFLEKGISSDELKKEAGGAAGLFLVRMRSPAGIAAALSGFEYLGYGAGGLDRYPQDLKAIKKPQVEEAIRRHLHPGHLTTVLAGTF